MKVLYLASTILSLFFILILAGKKHKTLSDSILIVWFIVLFSEVFSFYLILSHLAPDWLILFLDMSVFLHGPLLYFFTSSLTGAHTKFTWSDGLHLLPFVFFVASNVMLSRFDQNYLDVFNRGLIPLKFFIPLLYVLLSLRLVRSYRTRLENILSTTSRLELRWLSSILFGIIVLIIFGSVTILVHFLTPVVIPDNGGRYLNIAFSIFIILLGYFGFRQTTIFFPNHLYNNDLLVKDRLPADSGDKYKKSKLDKEEMEHIYKDLIKHMEGEKPFIDQNLTLYKLADQIGISENKLSQVINSITGGNFFDFVNRYRIKEVKERMKRGEHKHVTLLGLGYNSGFNSKASFNRAFRKYTGVTPSEYLRGLK